MTSKSEKEAFVWIWVPDETHPIVAGRLEADNSNVLFNYGKSYLERINDSKPVMSIYEPELPLKAGALPLSEGMTMPGCIRDAAPDAWGRRVIINKKLGLKCADTDTTELDELTYLLESGSDRIGALDFQRSPTEYVPRATNNVSMEELIESAERVEKGVPLTPELDQALIHGSSVGGARPKALIQDQGKKYVAKFSASTDRYSVVKAEFIAMRLASIAQRIKSATILDVGIKVNPGANSAIAQAGAHAEVASALSLGYYALNSEILPALLGMAVGS